MSYLVRSKWFKKLILDFNQTSLRTNELNIETPGFQLTKYIPRRFQTGTVSKVASLQDTLLSLLNYRQYESGRNNRLMDRLRTLSVDRINTLNQIGYVSKIAQVQNSISQNAILAETIAQRIIDKFDSQMDTFPEEISSLKQLLTLGQKAQGNQTHRVQEALSHLCRDYNSEFNEREVQPIIQYIKKVINEKTNTEGKTLIVVPGAGAGYIAYKLAHTFQDVDVTSIEYSGLMYVCQDYAMQSNGSDPQLSVRPFAQHYSGQQNSDLQNKEFKLDLLPGKIPTNLTHLWGDFTEYEPGNKYDTIIVVTAYFIDTAANMFDYIDKMEQLKQCVTETTGNVHWINAGPLKYGTQPIIQLNCDEISKYIKLQGWSQDCIEIDTDGGDYLTNRNGLYQGQYTLYKFHTKL